MPPLKADYQTLYQTDYLQWIDTTVEKLRHRDYGNVDWENLIEEIEDIGRSERRSLKSNLIVVLVHLLKWQFQPDSRSGSWEGSIVRIADGFKTLSTTRPVFNLTLRVFLPRAIPKPSSKRKLKPGYH